MGAKGASKSTNPAAARGIAYHQRFYRHLRQAFPERYPQHRLIIEPWFIHETTKARRSPDTVVIDHSTGTGIVIEVKMNWAGGRDEKLINEYLPIVQNAFGLECVWPLLVTGNVRGASQKPLLWTADLAPLERCMEWFPGDETPLALFIR